jgi:hypothetical protein
MFKKLAIAALLLTPAFASAGVYVTAGAAIGNTDMSDVQDEVYTNNGASSTVDDDLQRAVIGIGVDISENLAVEATYMTEAEATIVDDMGLNLRTRLKHSNLQLAALGKLPLTPQFALLGKLSANIAPTDASFDAPSVSYSYSESSSGVYLGFGVGASYQFTDTVGLQFIAERIQLKDVIDENQIYNNDFDVNQFSLALKFGF